MKNYNSFIELFKDNKGEVIAIFLVSAIFTFIMFTTIYDVYKPISSTFSLLFFMGTSFFILIWLIIPKKVMNKKDKSIAKEKEKKREQLFIKN